MYNQSIMAETAADPLIDSLVADFGGNYTFALELLEQYRLDRNSVDPSWREYFDRMMGVAPPPPARVEPVLRSEERRVGKEC